MTIDITDQLRRIVYAGNTTIGPFSFPFEIIDENDLGVYVNSTLLTITSDYTVEINADGTGSIELVIGNTLSDVPTSSDTIGIFGNKGIQRQTDFTTGGDLFANSLNDEFDAQTIFAQQNSEAIQRSVRAPVTDPTNIDMTLPSKADRLGAVLGFDETTGNPVAGPTISDVQTLSEVSADIATLADIEDGTVFTNAIQTVAGISSDVSAVANISVSVDYVGDNIADVVTVAADSADIGTVATNIADVNVVASNIDDVQTVSNYQANVSTVAASIDDVNRYANEYQISITEPTSPSEGDLWYDSANNALKYYDGSSWRDFVAEAEAALDQIESFYVGAAASNPTTDANGNALTAGDWYFNTTDNQTYIYNGSTWDAIAPDLIGDATPQLGGDLDVNDYSIKANAGEAVNIKSDYFYVKEATGTETLISAQVGGASTLYYDNNPVLTTTTTGIDVINSSSDAAIELRASNTSQAYLYFSDPDATKGYIKYDHTNDGMVFRTNGSDAMRILSSGDVVISDAGVTAAAGQLHIHKDGVNNANLRITNGSTGLSSSDGLEISMTSDSDVYFTNNEAGNIVFETAGLPYLKIRSWGDIEFLENTGTTSMLIWDVSEDALHFKDYSKAVFGDDNDLTISYDPTSTRQAHVQASGVLFLQGNGNPVSIGNGASAGTENIRLQEDTLVKGHVNADDGFNIGGGTSLTSTNLTVGTTSLYDTNIHLSTILGGLKINAATNSGGQLTQVDFVGLDYAQTETNAFSILVNSSNRVDFDADIRLKDNVELRFGSSTGDLKIYHDGSNSYIKDNGTGNLILDSATTEFTGNATFGDNDKAIFGAGSDLEIFHDSGNSWIRDLGTGDLYIQGSDNVRIQVGDGAGGFQNALYALDQSETVIYFGGARKLATTSTGIDVTGTVTADGLTVDGSGTVSDDLLIGQNYSNDFSEVTIRGDAGSNASLGSFTWQNYRSGNNYPMGKIDVQRVSSDNAGAMLFSTGNGGSLAERMRIDSNGDISFYEDTGTTAKFFWDASAEQLAIGSNVNSISPFTISADAGTGGAVAFLRGSGVNNNGLVVDVSNTPSTYLADFRIGNTSKMRIDSSGNLLVGKTSPDIGTVGVEAQADGSLYVTKSLASGGQVALFNRQTSDGEIIDFRKDGTTVGSIGADSGDLYIGTGDTAVRFRDAGDDILPFNASTDADRDAAIDLGDASSRFKDLYLSGGVYLGGTGSANYLDDYETGTWTPTALSGFTGFSAVAYAKYVKVGQLVTIVIYAGPFTGMTSSQLIIGGLPFTVQSSEYSPGVAEFSNSNPVGYARAASSSSQLNIYKPNVTTGNRENYNGTSLATANHIICQVSYLTSS